MEEAATALAPPLWSISLPLSLSRSLSLSLVRGEAAGVTLLLEPLRQHDHSISDHTAPMLESKCTLRACYRPVLASTRSGGMAS